jgi:hypothetical protein
MNILNYLTPSFEEFVDAPVGADQLAHNSAAAVPGGTEVPGAAPVADTQTDSLEIPESVGPALVASSDEVQAAAVVEDPGHSEAAAAAAQASDSDAALLEQAQVAPAETGSADAAVDTTTTEEGTGDVSESAELGGDDTSTVDSTDGDIGGDELGGDATTDSTDLGDTGSDELGSTDDAAGDETDLGTDEALGDEGTEETGDDAGLGDLGETTDDTTTEEDGLGETETAEGGEDGLGDGTDGETETGEAEGEEETEEAGEAEGEEAGGEFEEAGEEGGDESDETSGSEEETTEEAEGEETDASEESGDETDSDEDDGVEVDIPDVDTETTEDDAVEAEEEAAEKVAEDEALEDEIIDTSKSVDELDEDAVAVEEFIGVLQHGIRTKRFNAQTVALAQSKLQKLSAKWQSEAPIIPSMEDYSEKNLGAYYTNSLESFSSFLKKIKHVRDSYLDSFAKNMNERLHLKSVDASIAAINKALDVQIMRIKDLKLEEAVSVKIPAVLRTKDGLNATLTKELKFLGQIAGVFNHDKKFLQGVASLISAAVKEGDAIKSTATLQKALKLALPADSYPVAAYKGSDMSDFHFVRADVKRTGSLVDDMKTLGKRAIHDSVQTNRGMSGAKDTEQFLKADVVKLLQFAKVLVGLSRGTSAAAGKDIIDSIHVVNTSKSEANQKDAKTGDAETRRSNDAAMNQMVTQFWYALQASSDNYAHFQWHIVLLVDNLVNLVKKVK